MSMKATKVWEEERADSIENQGTDEDIGNPTESTSGLIQLGNDMEEQCESAPSARALYRNTLQETWDGSYGEQQGLIS